MVGKLIVAEGCNGAGKTSVANALFEIMLQHDRKVRLHRDPGSTPIGEKIRDMVKNPDVKMQPMTQMLMYTAARAELCHEIEPWLKDGGSVIVDRWWHSTYAYQGVGGVDPQAIRKLVKMLTPEVCQSTRELSFFLDLPPHIAMERSGASAHGTDPEAGGDRFETQGIEFQQALIKRYSDLVYLGEITHVDVRGFHSAEQTANYLWHEHVRGITP